MLDCLNILLLFYLSIPAFFFSPSCKCCDNQCEWCTDNTMTGSQQVVIAGFANNSCTDCTTLNGTFTLPYTGGNNPTATCQWQTTPTKTLCTTSQTIVYNMNVNDIFGDGNNYVIITITPQSSGEAQTFYLNLSTTSKYDCSSFSSTNVPHQTGVNNNCDPTSATCTLTSL